MSEREHSVEDFWAENPMTYGDLHGKSQYGEQDVEFGSEEFFRRVDDTFYAWNRPLHGVMPFERIFPYGEFRDKKVLEIGCGMGTMAMNWAKAGARVTAVDLNQTAIRATQIRFERLGLEGDIQQSDGRELPFEPESFDYVYSWGVLHHSPDLEKSLCELGRVLKPGGGFGVMLYHRRSILYGYAIRYLEGWLHEEARHLNPLELASRYTDGDREEGNPHTWPITKEEGLAIFRLFAGEAKVRVLGTDLDDQLKLAVPGLGMMLPRIVKKSWARRLGWSLWFHGKK